ncbi:hypothetical protein TIFTF001_036139 [Ficus carica]|uniref:Secreted protein n=1 Tax=Ficus carica TaxID=3494 RepID=A0AA88E686_FICCA|nr:hypothetical protein TIFTF001_036139 [Ficus carica]
MLPNFGVIVLVIRFVRGVSRTPRAISSNPGVEVMALCFCDEKRCSICASNVLISSDIKLLIISSTFIICGGTGPSGGGGRSGVERRVGVVHLLESDPCAGCLCCARLSFPIDVYPGVGGLCVDSHQLVLENLVLCADAFHLALLAAGFPVKVPPDVHVRPPFCSMNLRCRIDKGLTMGAKL